MVPSVISLPVTSVKATKCFYSYHHCISSNYIVLSSFASRPSYSFCLLHTSIMAFPLPFATSILRTAHYPSIPSFLCNALPRLTLPRLTIRYLTLPCVTFLVHSFPLLTLPKHSPRCLPRRLHYSYCSIILCPLSFVLLQAVGLPTKSELHPNRSTLG